MPDQPISSGSHPAYRPDIDGLRAIAVLSVVFFHAFPSKLPGGFIGVDIFFVISGFLISSIIFKSLNNDDFSFADFYARRIKRILPALALVFLFCLVVGALKIPPSDFKIIGKHVFASVSFVENFVLLREDGYFDVSGELKPLLHIWSLSIEEQFYIFWPLLMAGVWRCKKYRLSFISVCFVLSMGANLLLVTHDRTLAFYLPFSRVWELMLGAMLSYLSLSTSTSAVTILTTSARSALSVVGLMLLALALLLLNRDSVFPGYWALLPCLGACFLIAAGPSAIVNRLLLSNRFLVYVGLISYPLYLWHWPLLVFLNYTGAGGHVAYRAGIVILSIILAWLTYRLAERPIRASKAGKRVVALLLTAIVLEGAAGAYFYVNGGYVRYYSSELRSFLNYEYDYKNDFRNGECLLSGEQKTFSSKCVESANVAAGLPLIFIWGDSHGAQLFRSIEALHGEARFSLAQFTSSSCPPFLNFEKKDRPYCGMLNRVVAQRIEELRPHTVLLAHDWPQSVDENSLSHLSETVRFLRDNGVVNIVMIGPVPHWRVSLASSMSEYLKQSGASDIPGRSRFGLLESIKDLDGKMRKLADQERINYISPYDSLCNADGCMTRMPEYPSIPSAFDTAHFTRPTADRFVQTNKDLLLR